MMASRSSSRHTSGRRVPSLPTQVLLGFVLGIAAGVFLGEMAGVFNFVGQAFIQLLQMTVMPYVVVSLVGGLGQLGARDASQLALKVGAFVLVFWVIGLVLVALMPLGFPDWESSTFFSSSLLGESQSVDFIDLYFTHNPFNAMANTVVPATVLFSMALGVGLMGVKDKGRIIDVLSVLGDALSKVAGFVTRLAPIGVFAIAANTAGTIEVRDFESLQVYVVLHAGIATILALLVFPGMVALLTPLRYAQVIRRTWGAMITAFATGSVFVVLPMLSNSVRELLEEIELDREEVQTSIDVIVPTTYNFPSLGSVLSLFFLLFAGWFTGAAISVSSYPALLVTGLFSLFGSATLAIPFLLDFVQLPADLFQLYIAVDVISSRFAMMLATMHIGALALLGVCAMRGRVKLPTKKLIPYLGMTATAVALVLVGSHLFFTHVMSREYEGYRTFVEMDLRSERVPETIRGDPEAIPPDPRPSLERIADRGVLRVCYRREALPFAFRNSSGQLAGFDVDVAHSLAQQLDVTLEFVTVELDAVPLALQSGICEVAMTGLGVTPERARYVAFTAHHIDEAVAFLVPDRRRDEFNSRQALQAHDRLRLGMPDSPYYESKVRDYLPQAELVMMDSPRPFLRGEAEDLDGYVYTAEAASAWTLVYPDFTVAVPKPDILRAPRAYAVRLDDDEWLRYLDTWIELKQKDRTFDEIYDHWILGRDAADEGPRWCVIRDVLGWVE